MTITRFRCQHCGKLTTGRLPGRSNDGGIARVADGTLRYPRRHKYKSVNCPGNLMEAEWVDVEDDKTINHSQQNGDTR